MISDHVTALTGECQRNSIPVQKGLRAQELASVRVVEPRALIRSDLWSMISWANLTFRASSIDIFHISDGALWQVILLPLGAQKSFTKRLSLAQDLSWSYAV